MKKCMLLMTLLCMVLCLGVRAEARAEHHSHCVCGGAAVGVGDHTCREVTQWTPLSATFDLGSLESGAYYLTQDIHLTTATSILGDMDPVDTNSDGTADYYALTKAKTVTLCLNGHTLSTGKDRILKGLGQQCVLNICDCSYNGHGFEGLVIGGSSTNGTVGYIYSQSTLNIFGGNFTGKAGVTTKNGGLFVVAQDRWPSGGSKENAAYGSLCNLYNGVLYGGCSEAGGNVNIMHCSRMKLYGGVIRDGRAVKTATGTRGYGGNILCNSTAYLDFLGTDSSPVVISGGTAQNSAGNLYFTGGRSYTPTGTRIFGGSPEVALGMAGDQVVRSYTSLDNIQDSYLYMLTDLEAAVTLPETLTLDLNGQHLSGVTLPKSIRILDSQTRGYVDRGAGSLTPEAGVPQATWTGSGESWLALPEKGSYSFHHYRMAITKLTLRPDTRGFGYKAIFQGSDTLKENLKSYGYSLWITQDNPVTRSRPARAFVSGQELTLRIDNFLDPKATPEENSRRAQLPVHASVYLELTDGSRIETGAAAHHLRQTVEQADSLALSNAQRQALDSLCAQFSQTMLSWDIPGSHHATGSIWKQVNDTAFLAMLKPSGAYYNIPGGSYVLSSDVDISDRTLRIAPGTEVSLCLNGHTVSGTNRMFRNYGTLNICDCHKNNEGTFTSTYTPETGYASVIYCYYNSVTNLYGGNLTGTGTVTSAGVVAVSHDGGTSNATKPAAVFNMYGGTLAGGKATNEGGLVAIWNGGTFNLYDGTLSGGTAARGGGVYVGGGTFRTWGGTLADCTATEGGNVYATVGAHLDLGGGTITGGSASDDGGGVYVCGNSTRLSGDLNISGNRGTDLYMTCGATLEAIDLSANANVVLDPVGKGLLSDADQSVRGLTLAEDGYEFRYFNGNLLILKKGTILGTTTRGFSAGYSKVCITPRELGLPLSGFGRSADRAVNQTVGEDLYVTTIAITDAQGNTVLLAACDLQRPQKAVTDVLRAHMSAVTGVPAENIYINASHSHSTPDLYSNASIINRYKGLLAECFAQSAAEAMADRAPVDLYAGSFDVEGLNFTRHYYYVDSAGVTHYFGDNFNSAPTGVDFFHVTENDPAMHLLKFDRQNKTDILLCNWRAHPTMTGSATASVISSDFVGPMRDKAEELTGMHFAFIQGAAGNQNTKSRIPEEKHNLGYKAYGQAVATQMFENLDCLEPVESGTVRTESYIYTATVDHSESTAERVKQAEAVTADYWDLTATERKALLAEYGFSSVYHAGSVISKSKLGTTLDFELNVFSIGDTLGFYTAPGELWNTISKAVEAASPFEKTFTVGYCNDDDKYFLYGEVMEYESYESVYARFVMPQTSQDMIDYWTAALKRLYAANG